MQQKPDLCWIILAQLSRATQACCPEKKLSIHVGDLRKICDVFSACIQDSSQLRAHSDLICGHSFSDAELQPNKPSVSWVSSLCLCPQAFNLVLDCKYFLSSPPLMQILSLSSLDVLTPSCWIGHCFSQLPQLSSLNSLSTIFLTPHFLCSHRQFDYTSLDHKPIPCITSNT